MDITFIIEHPPQRFITKQRHRCCSVSVQAILLGLKATVVNQEREEPQSVLPTYTVSPEASRASTQAAAMASALRRLMPG